MKELFGLFAQIAVSRKGPQDLPASSLVLALTVLGYWLVGYVAGRVLPPTVHWRLHLVIDIVFTLLWYALLLRSARRPERFVQTATAFFGVSSLLLPVWNVAIHYSLVLPKEHALYNPVVFCALAIAIWVIRAGSYILKAALELPFAACVLLMILQIFTGDLLMQAFTPAPLINI
jgi:hypothetical protein